jgi:prevent-host-death family protein
MARHVSAREARNRFADIMGSVRYGGEEVIVERAGRPVMVIRPDTVQVFRLRIRARLLQTKTPEFPPC